MVALIERVTASPTTTGSSGGAPPRRSYVEFEDEIERLLKDASAGLCVDTGHAAYAGIRPEALIERYGSRVRHIHLKDVDGQVLAHALTRSSASGTRWQPACSARRRRRRLRRRDRRARRSRLRRSRDDRAGPRARRARRWTTSPRRWPRAEQGVQVPADRRAAPHRRRRRRAHRPGRAPPRLAADPEHLAIAGIADPARRWSGRSPPLRARDRIPSLARAVEREELDAVAVCSPHSTHAEVVLAALDRGVPRSSRSRCASSSRTPSRSRSRRARPGWWSRSAT